MTTADDLTLEQCIARKLMLDIRCYNDGDGPLPVRQLPESLARGLASLQPCGVILFRENLASVAQCQALTAELRQALSPQALIGIDQEGGRVTRLPREEVTSFSGNMALAACPQEERAGLAQDMGTAQGRELAALGINVNFAPTLDVNSNPHNPVINVRAFGDDADTVANLGGQLIRGLQGQGVAAAAKHFPGHGDTSQDSHTDLPRVTRDEASAWRTDLAPFAGVLRSAPPALVMTAHIQYPALDATTLAGTQVICPATLSRRIITGLLRERMGFGGVVISDALDMRAISALMTPVDAVVACFRAGVDIALMPLLVRSPQSLQQLQSLVGNVAERVRSGQLDESELRDSAVRVLALQAKYAPPDGAGVSRSSIACASHLALEQHIAERAVTLVSGSLPAVTTETALHLLMPSAESAKALSEALLRCHPSLRVSWQSVENMDLQRERALVAACDIYLVAVGATVASAVDLGGAEDLGDLPAAGPAGLAQHFLAAANGRHRIAVMLYSPYAAPTLAEVAETVLATYDGAPVGHGGVPGPAYQALARVLAGAIAPVGRLPIRL